MVEVEAVKIDGLNISLGFVIGAVLAYYLVSHKAKTGSWI